MTSALRGDLPRVVLPFAAGYFLSYFLRNTNAILAPELSRELGLTAGDLGLLTAAYLIAFSLAQLPIGLLLDRYGPRRVEAALLAVAAAGAALFALGQTPLQLALARALIGLGVSACLMGAFKAVALRFPADRLPALNATILAAGAFGALSASLPLSWLLPLFGWRGIFAGLAVACALAALLIAGTPEAPIHRGRESLGAQIRGLARILSSPVYWRIAPQGALVGGGMMAVLGLWAVPWMMATAGFSRDRAAFHLALTGLATLLGYLSVAAVSRALARRGIATERQMVGGFLATLGVTALIVFDLGPSEVLWFLLGVAYTPCNLGFLVASAQFPAHLSGRCNTALNLLGFVVAFLVQWGFGALVDRLIAAQFPPATAYRLTYGALLALQALSVLWFLTGWRRVVSTHRERLQAPGDRAANPLEQGSKAPD